MAEKRATNRKTPEKPHLPIGNTEYQLDGKFECQPEYRKAYIDYITREQIERQTRISEKNLKIKPSSMLKPNKSNNNTEQVTFLKSKLPVSVMLHQPHKHRRSSLSPPAKASSKDKMEERLFGAKVDTHSRSKTVDPPVIRHAKHIKPRQRFGSPVLVENLAYMPKTSPVQDILRIAARESQDSIEVDDTPFVVIEKRFCNNKLASHKPLCSDQKWMPSWHVHPVT